MLFNSIEFLVFFLIVSSLYFANTYFLRKNFISQLLLLASSLYFYACWNAKYLCLILLSVFVTYSSGILMEKKPPVKKFILFASLFINLLILVFFKYSNFIGGTINSIGSLFGTNKIVPEFNILLPVGISFYTFQALGYSMDVYRGTLKAERNLLTYTLFVTFFPQLVAGPIERSTNLLPQFKSDYKFDYARVTDGLKLSAWGLFKKIVISDYLALYVNGIYNNLPGATGASVLLATFYFSIQIFCDFSGYSDIAIGVSKILGFSLMKNFNKPYFSVSIVDFWRNWHISLSLWFRDYLYIPLGGNRKGVARRYINLFITFLVSGLWHGANFTFILWGVIHGLYQIIGLSTIKARNRLLARIGLISSDGQCRTGLLLFRIGFTYILVCFAWIFFRANNIHDIPLIFSKIGNLFTELKAFLSCIPEYGLKESLRARLLLEHGLSGHAMTELIISFFYVFILFMVGLYTRKESGLAIIRRKNIVIRWLCYYAVMIIIVYSYFTSHGETQFIYFQF